VSLVHMFYRAPLQLMLSDARSRIIMLGLRGVQLSILFDHARCVHTHIWRTFVTAGSFQCISEYISAIHTLLYGPSQCRLCYFCWIRCMYFVFFCICRAGHCYRACMRCSRGYFYIEGNLNMGATDDDGCTCLHLACEEWSHWTLHGLLNRGADVNAKNRHDRTALHT
jgi:hypothetical protein